MDYFNLNAFYLGVLLFTSLFVSNIIYSLICLIWKIKIVEFAVFANAWFALHKEKIMGTIFILGWLPISGHIKPLGMRADEEDKAKINPLDLPRAMFNKPKYLQKVFQFVPWLISIGAALIAIYVNSSSSFSYDLVAIINYIVEGSSTMFTNNVEAREKFMVSTTQITNGKNVVVFAFAILTIAMLLLIPFTSIMNWFSDTSKLNTLQKAFGFVVTTIATLWFILWKIPKFVFSFFTFSQGIIYLGCFLVGMFSVGLVLFYTTLFVVKNVAQTINDNRLKSF